MQQLALCCIPEIVVREAIPELIEGILVRSSIVGMFIESAATTGMYSIRFRSNCLALSAIPWKTRAA
jgi:hypothetical protein